MFEAKQEKPRILPAQERRVETGPIRFGDDWTGVFIRGDDAYILSVKVRIFLNQSRDSLSALDQELFGHLLALLTSSDERVLYPGGRNAHPGR